MHATGDQDSGTGHAVGRPSGTPPAAGAPIARGLSGA